MSMQPVPTQQPPPAWEEDLHPRENYEVTIWLSVMLSKWCILPVLLKIPSDIKCGIQKGQNQLSVSVLSVFVLNFLADSSKLCRADRRSKA